MDQLGRADVETRHRWQVIGGLRREKARHSIGWQGQGKSSTHGASLPQNGNADQRSYIPALMRQFCYPSSRTVTRRWIRASPIRAPATIPNGASPNPDKTSPPIADPKAAPT